jgi:uridine kinase
MAAFVIGIGGGSASGKSTIAQKLGERLGPLRVEVLHQDRFFLDRAKLPRHTHPGRGRSWPDYNQPGSFDFPALRRALRAARETDAEVVILEGILALYDPEVRELLHLKVFVDTEPDERIVRRMRRNVARGQILDDIGEFYLDSVRHRHREFCQPTREYADLVIPGGREDSDQAERLLDEVCRRVRAARSSPGD